MYKNARGVILAGGNGLRLRPLTEVTNKHLLPVFDLPMVMHPINTLKSIGIKHICIVTSAEYIANFMGYLRDGEKFGVRFTYKVQEKPRGIADALLQARDFFNNEDKVVAILGDNIFERVVAPKIALNDDFSYLFLKEVRGLNRRRFGIASLDKNGKVVRIDEKPQKPDSNYAVTGLYIYPNDVFNIIGHLKPSSRGELEITDVNNHYLKEKKLKIIKIKGFWIDAGTQESLLEASVLRAKEIDLAMFNKIKKEIFKKRN